VALIDIEPALLEVAAQLGEALRARGAHLALAESCTGGLIAGACTAVAGSSDWFDIGWVTYSNAAKSAALGVPQALIAVHGAVSREVAEAMAQGALSRSGASFALAVTGIAGPGGGSADKPVGTVWIALAIGSPNPVGVAPTGAARGHVDADGNDGTGVDTHLSADADANADADADAEADADEHGNGNEHATATVLTGARRLQLQGDRAAIRAQTVAVALDWLRRAAVAPSAAFEQMSLPPDVPA